MPTVEQITLRFHPETAKKLRKIAEKKKISIAAAARALLVEALEMDPEDTVVARQGRPPK